VAQKLFTDDEIEILKNNKYTYSVINWLIKFSVEFKQLFYDKMQTEFYPPKVIEKLMTYHKNKLKTETLIHSD